MTRPEIYVSVDIEADGPIPGPNSMLALGAVAFDPEGIELSEFYRRLRPLQGSAPDSKTFAWWKKNPEAWEEATRLPKSPPLVMREFYDWLLGLPGKPVFVGYPASFDFMFTYWYLMKFVGSSPFGFQALDLKTLAYSRLGLPFREVTKSTMPREWFGETKHSHVAVEDAREQGHLFFRIREGLPRDRDVVSCRVHAAVTSVLEALEGIEWVRFEHSLYGEPWFLACPSCDGEKEEEGHCEDCKLAIAIKAIKASGIETKKVQA